MRRYLLLACLLPILAGCGRPPRDSATPADTRPAAAGLVAVAPRAAERPKPTPPAAPTPAPAPAPPVYDVADVWEAFASDAAAAELRFGKRPRFRVTVDSVEKGLGGYVVRRDLRPGRVICRFSSADGLAGAVGRLIVVTGEVTTADRIGIQFRGCALVR